MLAVPGMTVTAPMDGVEMLGLLRTGVDHLDGPFAIRWPRDAVPAEVPPMADVPAVPFGTWEVVRKGSGLAILAVGTMVLPAVAAAQRLSAEGTEVSVVNCRFLKPYDREVFERIVASHEAFLMVEEGTVVNGFGAFMAHEITSFAGERSVAVEAMGIPDRFIEHGPRKELLAEIGLDADGITAVARGIVGRRGLHQTARETA